MVSSKLCFGHGNSKLKTKPEKQKEYVPMETRDVFILVSEAAPPSGVFGDSDAKRKRGRW